MRSKILLIITLVMILLITTASVAVVPDNMDVKSETTAVQPANGEYTILSKRNIDRVSVYDKGEALYEVSFTFNKAFAPRDVYDIRLTGDSGIQEVGDNFTGFKNVEFPFKGKINYTTPDKFHRYEVRCEFEIVIYKPGNWEINLVK